MKTRCPWPSDDKLMIKYHDKEWGVPLHNDKKLFEFLILEGFQAGLSWKTILHKRKNFRKAFDNFDFNKVAKYDKRKVNSLLKDTGIIRNRLKIEGAISNAITSGNNAFQMIVDGFKNMLAQMAAELAAKSFIFSLFSLFIPGFSFGGAMAGSGGLAGALFKASSSGSGGSDVPSVAPVNPSGGQANINLNFSGPISDKQYIRKVIVPEVTKAARLGIA